MAYKIAVSSKSEEKEIKNPAKFFNMIVFQFINPKAVLIAIITVSTFISQNENFLCDITNIFIKNRIARSNFYLSYISIPKE